MTIVESGFSKPCGSPGTSKATVGAGSRPGVSLDEAVELVRADAN